ncbi:MAG: hypothetical protein JXA23_01360 [Bacteroidales bacterium]|nr:hypothetical protein [Bacteroidales bacterium]
MAKIQIPKQFLEGFKALYAIDENDFQRLIDSLQIVPVGLGPNSFIKTLKSNLEYPWISQVAATIFSLGSLLESQEFTNDELSNELASAYGEGLDLTLAEEQKAIYSKRNKELLKNLGSLKLSFKALNLLTENNQNFVESHIITDIRLVFQEEIDQKNRNAVIIHKLKIDYRKEGEPKQFYIALDNNDLKKLKKQIDRALEKEEIIKKDYSNSISFIEITD